ncbi:MAG: DUF5362 domain-containing protein [Clostridiales bacterium]|jgi:hypothetical protein|nr:DUF5362 domain-containing protein [Eubacteriales bacterium]MDH7565370.1 DUF5362 domain-containing protein [Clostridiales bacterium]
MDEVYSEKVEPNNDLNALRGKKLTGWASLMGVLTIIGGAITCLGIITAAIGVPMIIAGLKLLKAVDNTKAFSDTDDVRKLGEAMDNLNRYFKINGIVALVGLALYILLLLLMMAGVFTLPRPQIY